MGRKVKDKSIKECVKCGGALFISAVGVAVLISTFCTEKKCKYDDLPSDTAGYYINDFGFNERISTTPVSNVPTYEISHSTDTLKKVI